jgi:hypothetical protein
MANAIFNNPGNSVEGRIERLQIMRSDGTIRESKQVNIHNTIVNCGLDNILTVGGFAQGSNTNNKTLAINYYSNNNTDLYPSLHYSLGLWLRMLWFMKLGTDHNNNITLYDMTDLVEPYVNADQETYSQSHYIPTSTNLAIRGTTHDSMIEGDIHSTHRITSNSVKVTEDNTEITEIGFFVGINNSFTTFWTSQVFTPGDMFCRINLGEHKVTLNAGERLVVTYALTEYAGASKHQPVNDIHLVDAEGNPIKFKDDDGVEHTIGAIARCWMCDGKANMTNYNDWTMEKLPGDFNCIATTSDRGYAIGKARGCYSYNLRSVYTLPVYATVNYNYCGPMDPYFYDVRWGSTSNWECSSICNFRLAYNMTLINDGDYNSLDAYGFPSINTKTSMRYGSRFAYYYQNSSNLLSTAGRCNNNATNPTPNSNYTGTHISYDYIQPTPTIKAYTRGTFYRDQEWVSPTYYPNYYDGSTTSLPDPRYTANIYWINIRGMLYRIGYFQEEGNIDTFVPCPIKKKRGQVFRCTFREYVGRHVAGA